MLEITEVLAADRSHAKLVTLSNPFTPVKSLNPGKLFQPKKESVIIRKESKKAAQGARG